MEWYGIILIVPYTSLEWQETSEGGIVDNVTILIFCEGNRGRSVSAWKIGTSKRATPTPKTAGEICAAEGKFGNSESSKRQQYR